MSEQRRPADVITDTDRHSRRAERRTAAAPRYPGYQTLLARGDTPDPCASRSVTVRASGTTKRAAVRRASGTTSREGGQK